MHLVFIERLPHCVMRLLTLCLKYELKILAVRAEEKAKYDAQLDAVRIPRHLLAR